MAIRKRGKTWQIDYIDITGKRVRKSGFRTKIEAEHSLSLAKINRNKGITNIINREITIKTASEYFLSKYAKLQCAKHTFDEYERIVLKSIIPFFYNMKVADLSKIHVEEYRDYLIYKKNLANTTVNKHLFVLSTIIEKQVENGYIFINVVKKVNKLSATESPAKALNDDEINILLSTAKSEMPDFYPIVLLALNTGLRRGEIVALKWENIDLKNNKINVKHSAYNGVLTKPKTKSSYRTLEIPSNLHNVLVKLKLKSYDNEFVFTNLNGNMLDPHKISSKLFPKLIKLSKLEHYRFHDLRHTFGSQLVCNGVNIKYVQVQMGHSKIKTTLDIYGHLLSDVNEQAMNILNKVCSVS